MNKILIVGHPQSGYEEVEELLNACGMAGAQPSRREGYLPQQISATLCKAHNASTLQRIEAGCDVRQIEVGPLWHGMALDLMLGNLDQEFWGWSDPQAIFLLDYWLSLDPAITFVFVYDQPQSVLARMNAQSAAGLDPQSLQQRAHGWTAYNTALLHFFLRHPRRCLLVNTQQVRASAASYLQQMRARIDAPWSERMDQLAGRRALTESGMPVDAGMVVDDSLTLAAADLTANTARRPSSDALTSYLADALLCQHTASLQIYEELQSCANLPLSDEASRSMPAALAAWQSMMARQLEQQQRITELTKVCVTLETRQRELKEESQLLLNQLYQVQEELEHHHLEDQQKSRQLEALKKVEASLLQTNNVQQKELESLRAKSSASPADLLHENELLLNQLHQLQEAIDRDYLDIQKSKQKPAPKKPTEPVVYYGAGQRIRQQLSYKLGATMIKCSHSVGGWVRMPIELLRVSSQHKQELPFRQPQKLPPISKYHDVHEAERHRNHLSYRLGQILVKNVRSPIGWMRIPLAIRREVLDFRRQRS